MARRTTGLFVLLVACASPDDLPLGGERGDAAFPDTADAGGAPSIWRDGSAPSSDGLPPRGLGGGGIPGKGGRTASGGTSSTGGSPPSAGGSPGTGGAPTASGGAEPGTGGISPGAGGALPPGAGGAPALTRRVAGGRGFLVHVPPSLDPNVPAPVLFVHHGYNGTAERARQLTRFDALANEKGFIAVFPEGAGATWNAGLGVCGLGQFVTGLGDDFAFVQAMLASLESDLRIDRARVFVTGFSMGGYFSNHVGCMRPDLVRGIAPHSGGGPPPGCAATRVPALIVHGTADSLIWYDCGVQARRFWATHNGCSQEVDIVPIKGGACEWHRACPPGAQVGFCHLDGMPHGWAGTDGTDGGGKQYEDISRVIWDFFARQ